MKFDEYGLLITNEPPPGCYGDSCAETSRSGFIHRMNGIVQLEFSSRILPQFFTDKGILRHPLSPWREDDTSQDQKLPLFLYLDSIGSSYLLQRYKSFDKLWFLKRLVGIRTLGQALIFRIPFRWNDGKKAFESSNDSSCDYLNFGAQIFYSYFTGRDKFLINQSKKLVPQDKMIREIVSYYSNDLPNNQWLIDLWIKAIEIVWT